MPKALPPEVTPGSGPARVIPRTASAAPGTRVSVPKGAPAWPTFQLDGDQITVNRPKEMPDVVMSGELDIATAPVLRAAVAAAIDRRAALGTQPAGPFLLDLAQVTFMDSSALHALHDIRGRLGAHGWTLGLTPPTARGPRRFLLLAAALGWVPRW
jgi:anti-anti-sigma factor